MNLVVDNPKDYWRVASSAEKYERARFGGLNGRLYRLLEERAIRRAMRALKQNRRMLDVACGTGRITSLLVREGFPAVGSDISMPMMSVARRRLAEMPFLQSDVTRLPFSDNSFEAITCIGLLMHLDGNTRVKVLQELARVSRRLLVVQYGWVGAFMRVKTWVTGQAVGGVRYPVAEAELRSDLQRSGVTELARFWVLRPFSSSVILLLAK